MRYRNAVEAQTLALTLSRHYGRDLFLSDNSPLEEKLEAARWLSFLKLEGKLVVNDQCIDPMPVITGAAEYPQNISEAIKAAGASMIELDALSLAVKAGSAKAVNVVLIGAMASHMQLSYETWTNAIRNTVPEKFLDMNLEAFRLGYEHEKSC